MEADEEHIAKKEITKVKEEKVARINQDVDTSIK
jgi:hypothetical protein